MKRRETPNSTSFYFANILSLACIAKNLIELCITCSIDCEQSLFSSKTGGGGGSAKQISVTWEQRAATLRSASSAGVRRRTKRKIAMVSYNILDARHSGNRVIILVVFQRPLAAYTSRLQSRLGAYYLLCVLTWDFRAKERLLAVYM